MILCRNIQFCLAKIGFVVEVLHLSLEKNGITANKNGVPGDTRGFVETSGVRIGVAAETTRGHDERWFKNLALQMIYLLRD